MQDNALIQLFIPIIQAGLAANGITGVPIVQAYEPTQQGINSVATIYYSKIADKRYQFIGSSNDYDTLTQQMILTETQNYETTFQISALATQDPNNLSLPTASDLVNFAAYAIQSQLARDTLNASGVGVLRVTDIRNNSFTDDRDRFEFEPSFDFILTHQQITQTVIPVIQSTQSGIFGV